MVARLRTPSLADVDEAIARADHAFRTSGWAQRKPHEREAVLYRVASLIRAKVNADDYARFGKIIKEFGIQAD